MYPYSYSYYRQQPQGFFPGSTISNINRRLDRIENRLNEQDRKLRQLNRRLRRVERQVGFSVFGTDEDF
ncbi:hypothetical protein [Priestia endophytica]|jgi:tetrahydromethanopterin S-methyltransferase subunit G|uniref:hypothetical protein n=1 Tax=Priestia endophytica TaxID=135735 RepID=UPI000F524CFA|nr:hypothetical protein [Priestia endophytica]RPK16114.1 hypothetical protein FH5_01554 [Priestia endophytica]